MSPCLPLFLPSTPFMSQNIQGRGAGLLVSHVLMCPILIALLPLVLMCLISYFPHARQGPGVRNGPNTKHTRNVEHAPITKHGAWEPGPFTTHAPGTIDHGAPTAHGPWAHGPWAHGPMAHGATRHKGPKPQDIPIAILAQDQHSSRYSAAPWQMSMAVLFVGTSLQLLGPFRRLFVGTSLQLLGPFRRLLTLGMDA